LAFFQAEGGARQFETAGIGEPWDVNLKVYGIENLRITDVSVMPRNGSKAVAQIGA
jgi:hypothetical protein